MVSAAVWYCVPAVSPVPWEPIESVSESSVDSLGAVGTEVVLGLRLRLVGCRPAVSTNPVWPTVCDLVRSPIPVAFEFVLRRLRSSSPVRSLRLREGWLSPSASSVSLALRVL